MNHYPTGDDPDDSANTNPASQRATESFRQRRIASLLALAGRRRLSPPSVPDPAFVRQTMRRITGGKASAVRFQAGPNPGSPTASRLWAGAMAAVALVLVTLVALGPSQAPPARLTEATGAVTWKPSLQAVGILARPGLPLRDGFLETLTSDSSARVQLADGTQLTLSGAALLRLGFQEGKILELARGGLSADVQPQPPGHPLLVGTPEARLTVLGTRFLLESQAQSTRLEVTEGLVRMERLADGSATDVPARHQAVASPDNRATLSSRPTNNPVTAWRPSLRDQLTRGVWNPGDATRPPRIGSVPVEVPGDTAPVLLQVCSLHPSAGGTGPIQLSSGARFLVQGTSDPGREIFIGATVRHPGAGLAGPYSARFIPARAGPDGFFTAEVPVSALSPRMQGLPPSPEGMEMVDWWAGSRIPTNTVEIQSVELIPGQPAARGIPNQ